MFVCSLCSTRANAAVSASHALGELAASASSVPLRCWQTPDVFDLAEACQHLLMDLGYGCRFGCADMLDDESMRAVHDSERIGVHSWLRTAYIFIGDIGCVV